MFYYYKMDFELPNDDCDEWGFEYLVEGILLKPEPEPVLEPGPEPEITKNNVLILQDNNSTDNGVNNPSASPFYDAISLFDDLCKVRDIHGLKDIIKGKKELVIKLFDLYRTMSSTKNAQVNAQVNAAPNADILTPDQVAVLFNDLKWSNKKIFDIMELLYLHCYS